MFSSLIINNYSQKIDGIKLESPIIFNATGSVSIYFAKMLNNSKPLLIQTPVCKTKRGFRLKDRARYVDLIYTDESFIDLIKKIENKAIDILALKRDSWFSGSITKEDIKNAFVTCLRNGKDDTHHLRANFDKELKAHSNNSNKDTVELSEITKDQELLIVLEVHGVKFNSTSFKLDIKVKTVMLDADKDNNTDDEEDDENDNEVEQENNTEKVFKEKNVENHENDENENKLDNKDDSNNNDKDNNNDEYNDEYNEEYNEEYDKKEPLILGEEIEIDLSDLDDNSDTIHLKSEEEIYGKEYLTLRKELNNLKNKIVETMKGIIAIKSEHPFVNFKKYDNEISEIMELKEIDKIVNNYLKK